MEAPLFERYGGFGAVRQIVVAFMERMVQSRGLAPYFDHVDIRRLIDHQTKFIAYVMGGPASFTDRQLKRAHASLGVTSAEFAEMLELLQATLEEAELEAADVDHVLDEVRRREHLIVAGT